jgi:hypothetical protein
MITQQDLDAIITQVDQQGLSESVLAALRQQFDYHFTYCMDDDMDAHEPAMTRAGFNVYFVNSADHCAHLTKQPELASGFVFAEVIDDE